MPQCSIYFIFDHKETGRLLWCSCMKHGHSTSLVKSFSGFNSVSSFVSSEESAGRGDGDCIRPLNQETHRLSKQCASRCCWAATHDFKLSLCAKGCWFILFSNLEIDNLGYGSSCLPYLIDVTLIRITLHQHDRWKSSGRTHTITHVHRCWSTYSTHVT